MHNAHSPMTVKEKVGQLFFPAAYINDTEENYQIVEHLIEKCGIGGLTFFHSRLSAATNFEGKKTIIRNDQSASRLKTLIARFQNISKFPLLISIDAEWGLAMRVEKTPQYPYASTLGALPDSDDHLIFEIGQNIALDLKKLGINYNLAPVMDVNDNPKNPVIGYRSFGDNKFKVAQKALAFYNGMAIENVIGCMKHFPGHGNTAVDSHLGLPVIEKSLEQMHNQELVPFKEAIKQNVDSIMIGHLAVPALTNGKIISATLSFEIIQDLLRNELGFKGLVISDALNMKSVSNLYPEKGMLEWKAFEAGNDVLCFSENVNEGIEKILKNGSISQIEDSFQRLLHIKTKAKLFENNEFSEVLKFDFQKANILNQKIADRTICVNKNSTSLIPLKSNSKTAVISIYNSKKSAFCKTIYQSLPVHYIDIEAVKNFDFEALLQQLQDFETVVLALFVPSIKPLNNFEIDGEVFDFLTKAFQNPKVIYCHFGNPYALDLLSNLDHLNSYVVCYQHFDEFQIKAASILVH